MKDIGTFFSYGDFLYVVLEAPTASCVGCSFNDLDTGFCTRPYDSELVCKSGYRDDELDVIFCKIKTCHDE
ncbi:MAG: hypothetical protein LBN74_06330 [Prevotella sp.]|jgi:hypothetical protein|nr:hypothetical protein [Prevotella sp.]